MATVDTQDIARLRELHAAATAGEWERDGAITFYVWAPNAVRIADCGYNDADAAYIAAAHNALPAVLTALEQARAERDAALAELAALRAQLATAKEAQR